MEKAIPLKSNSRPSFLQTCFIIDPPTCNLTVFDYASELFTLATRE